MKFLRLVLILCALCANTMAGWGQTTFNGSPTSFSMTPSGTVSGTSCGFEFLAGLQFRFVSSAGGNITFEARTTSGNALPYNVEFYIKESTSSDIKTLLCASAVNSSTWYSGSSSITKAVAVSYTSGTRYYVAQFNFTSGNSTVRYYSNIVTVSASTTTNQAPSQPSNPTPGHTTTGVSLNPTFSWNSADPEGQQVNYKLMLSTVENTFTVEKQGTGTSTSSPYTLQPGTTYYWKIESYDNQGKTSIGPVWRFTTAGQPINPALSLSFTTIELGQTLIITGSSFSANKQAQLIFKKSNGSQYFSTYVNTNSSGAFTYFYQTTESGSITVTATDVTSGQQRSQTFTVNSASPAPSTPSNPTPANGATGVSVAPTLSWTSTVAGGGYVSFDFYIGTSSSNIPIRSSGSSPSRSLTGLTPNTTYYWKVVALNAQNVPTEGPVWTFTTIDNNQAPSQPSNPSPTNNATGVSLNPTFSWNSADPEGETVNFKLMLSTVENSFTVEKQGTGTSTASPYTLQAGTTYYWKIESYDNQGKTSISPTWHFTTTGPTINPVLSLSATNIDFGNSLTISGSNFSANKQVQLIFAKSNGSQYLSTYVNTNASGAFSYNHTTTESGVITITATDVTSGQQRSQSFSVNAPPPAPVNYTVTFNSNGGSPTPPSQSILSGGKVSQPTSPSRSGYTFDGWYYNTNPWNFAYDVVLSNITLTAKWSENAPSAPTTGATSVTNITTTSATLNGWVNPQGSTTAYLVQFSKNQTFAGNIINTNGVNAGSGTSNINISVSTTALEPQTNYWARIMVQNASSNIAYSNVITFKTSSLALSSDATLSSLNIPSVSLSPAFSPSVETYSASVANTVTSINISASANHPKASVTGVGAKSLNVGSNSFQITVTAENGTTKKTYTVNITRASQTPPSTQTPDIRMETNIAGISSTVTVGQTIYLNATIKNYNTTDWNIAFYLKDEDGVDVWPGLGDFVKIESGKSYTIQTKNSFTVPNKTGKKTWTLYYWIQGTSGGDKIKSQGSYSNQVTVQVNPSSQPTSSDATLKSLSVSPHSLSPAFSPDRLEYTVHVANNITSINLQVERNHTAATVTGDGNRTLIVGENNFSIVVTAQNGEKRVYSVKVSRATQTTQDQITLQTPTVNNNVVSLKWNSVSGVKSYQIYRNNVDKVQKEITSTLHPTNFIENDVSPLSGKNNYHVQAILNSGQKITSNTVSITITRTTTEAAKTTGTLQGTLKVKDKNTPIENALITLSHDGLPRAVSADGSFIINGIPYGTSGTVTVQKIGYDKFELKATNSTTISYSISEKNPTVSLTIVGTPSTTNSSPGQTPDFQLAQAIDNDFQHFIVDKNAIQPGKELKFNVKVKNISGKVWSGKIYFIQDNTNKNSQINTTEKRYSSVQSFKNLAIDKSIGVDFHFPTGLDGTHTLFYMVSEKEGEALQKMISPSSYRNPITLKFQNQETYKTVSGYINEVDAALQKFKNIGETAGFLSNTYSNYDIFSQISGEIRTYIENTYKITNIETIKGIVDEITYFLDKIEKMKEMQKKIDTPQGWFEIMREISKKGGGPLGDIFCTYFDVGESYLNKIFELAQQIRSAEFLLRLEDGEDLNINVYTGFLLNKYSESMINSQIEKIDMKYKIVGLDHNPDAVAWTTMPLVKKGNAKYYIQHLQVSGSQFFGSFEIHWKNGKILQVPASSANLTRWLGVGTFSFNIDLVSRSGENDMADIITLK